MRSQANSLRWAGPLAAIALVALAAFGYWSATTWLRPLLAPVEAPVTVLPVVSGCDWFRGCETTGALSVRVRVDRTVRPLQPFGITVDVGNLEADTVLADFVMVGMDMGVNRFPLGNAGAGQWQTQAILPVCTVDRQDWVARIFVAAEAAVYRIDVPFLTERE